MVWDFDLGGSFGWSLYVNGFLIPSLGFGFGTFGAAEQLQLIPAIYFKVSDSWEPPSE
jgi:hypothetical protein